MGKTKIVKNLQKDSNWMLGSNWMLDVLTLQSQHLQTFFLKNDY